MSIPRLTMTRKGPVPPWYGWASVFCPIVAPVLSVLLDPLKDLIPYGRYVGVMPLIVCYAFGTNYALQALFDSEQRGTAVLGAALLILGPVLWFPFGHWGF